MNRARDLALGSLVAKNVEPTIIALIKILCKEMGSESAAREFISLMDRLVSRQTCLASTFKELDALIIELDKKPTQIATGPDEQKSSLYNRLMFHVPEKDERVWTGDIYKAQTAKKYDQYAIVLNSPCDLAQSKTKKIRVCYAFSLVADFFDDLEYPPYKLDTSLCDKIGKEPDANVKKLAKEKYMGKEKLTDNFHVLHNFKENDQSFRLCFDFNNVNNIDLNEIGKWIRVCRLDSPYVEHMIQKYANCVFRIGTMPINV
jgi:hypothetical protein